MHQSISLSTYTHARFAMFVDHISLIQLEYKVPTAEEEWKNLLSLNAVETPEAILRKILPLILKGIVQGVLLNGNCLKI